MFIHKISKYITIYFSQKSRKRQLLKLANSLFYLLSVAANSAKYQLLIISFQVAWKSVCMPSFSFYHSSVPYFNSPITKCFCHKETNCFEKPFLVLEISPSPFSPFSPRSPRPLSSSSFTHFSNLSNWSNLFNLLNLVNLFTCLIYRTYSIYLIH